MPWVTLFLSSLCIWSLGIRVDGSWFTHQARSLSLQRPNNHSETPTEILLAVQSEVYLLLLLTAHSRLWDDSPSTHPPPRFPLAVHSINTPSGWMSGHVLPAAKDGTQCSLRITVDVNADKSYPWKCSFTIPFYVIQFYVIIVNLHAILNT